jgi:hypothetical protein
MRETVTGVMIRWSRAGLSVLPELTACLQPAAGARASQMPHSEPLTPGMDARQTNKESKLTEPQIKPYLPTTNQ